MTSNLLLWSTVAANLQVTRGVSCQTALLAGVWQSLTWCLLSQPSHITSMPRGRRRTQTPTTQQEPASSQVLLCDLQESDDDLMAAITAPLDELICMWYFCGMVNVDSLF